MNSRRVYSVFPNDGIRIAPHIIRRVAQADGLPLQQQRPQVSEAVPVDIAREMMVLLEAVVQHGTGAAAQMHHAFGGKTGTTNNFTDAWFIGFSPSVTCGAWVGFDDRQSLGEKETGAKAALPIWMDFMKVATAGKPNEAFAKPNAPKREIEVPEGPDPDAILAPKSPQGSGEPDAGDLSQPVPKGAPATPQSDALPQG